MKNLAVLLALIVLPVSTTFAYDLFKDDELRTLDGYSMTNRLSYEPIRARDFVPAHFDNSDKNSIYQTNVGEGQLKDIPGVIPGEECVFWKACLRKTVKKTGYDRSFQRKQKARTEEMSTLGYDRYAYTKRQSALDSSVDGKSKLIKLLSVMKKNRRAIK